MKNYLTCRVKFPLKRRRLVLIKAVFRNIVALTNSFLFLWIHYLFTLSMLGNLLAVVFLSAADVLTLKAPIMTAADDKLA